MHSAWAATATRPPRVSVPQPRDAGSKQTRETEVKETLERIDGDVAKQLALPEGAHAQVLDDVSDDTVREVETLIIGGGLSGLAVAAALKQDGREDFAIIERAHALGGTWHHNRYPGCAVDIPSHLYSFSFALNPDWSRTYAPQPELEAYLQQVAADEELARHASLDTEMFESHWDAEAQRWQVSTSRGAYRARFLVLATGPLHDPVIPELPGLGVFQGAMFHSANWPADDRDIAGRRVAVVGTGASAVQFVPEIQPLVNSMTVFQRTPGWVLPKIDWRTSRLERGLMRRFPAAMRAARELQWALLDSFFMLIVHRPRMAVLGHLAGRWNIRRGIADPALRRAVTPKYLITCKRAMFSNDYYRALGAPNVEVVSSGVQEIREHSIVAADGTEREIDTIIFGTGFHVLTTHPAAERVRGADGRTLADCWSGSPRGYLGTTVAGFPNLLTMFGPNIGTLSGFVMAECQAQYAASLLRELDRVHGAAFTVRQEVQDGFVNEVDDALEGSTFLVGGCTSYYLDRQGRVHQAWPWTMRRMRRRLARADLSDYRVDAPRVGLQDAQGAVTVAATKTGRAPSTSKPG